ncbi:MAG TPA: hypothetical protein DDW65_10380 [Firmicutes bacterium]|jgi:hypothetical protein|nr:hypothetical protein [Bacillota bacterium]
MKYRLIGLFILIGLLSLLLTVPGFANTSNNSGKPKNFFVAVKQGIINAFRDVKTETKKTGRNIKHGVVHGSRDVKTKTGQTGRNIKHGVKNGFQTVKQDFVNIFKRPPK